MAHAKATARLPDFAGRRILVVGDVMLDRYVYGEVARISPEAPIPVFRELRPGVDMLGGAGNLARNIADLGGTAVLIGLVGDDAEAVALRALAGATDRIEDRMLADPARPTTVKTRYVSRGHQMLRVDRELDGVVAGPVVDALIEAARAVVRDASMPVGAVVLSDYAKGVLSGAVVRPLVKAAAEAGIPVLVDPKIPRFDFYGDVDVLTPNAGELAAATGQPVGSNAAVEAAARTALSQCAASALVVTRAEHGLSVVPTEGAATHWPARARQVFDVSGAGDTVMAVLALATAAGLELADAAEFANIAGGLVVQKTGTATVSRAELAAACADAQAAVAERKLVDRAGLAERVAHWRDRGLRVGFTNGCFDLIHPGHVSLLRQARAACDRLVIGLNSDASVQRLKGAARPLQGENARAAVLAAFDTVDAVALFDDDTPLALIEAIRPDVLVKGADYTIATVVGAEQVQAYGGRVLLAEINPGHSTSAILARSGNGPGSKA